MSEVNTTSSKKAESLHSNGLALKNRLPRRATVFALISIVFALGCLLLAIEFFVVERLPALTETQLESAKKLWQESGPRSYNMDIELRGAQSGVVHVEVQNGEVTATTRDNRVPPPWTWDTWSVSGMFDTLAQDLQIAEDPAQEIQAAPGTKWRLRCEFDSKFGFPRRYHRLVTGGPEVYWQVTRFDPK